MLRTHRTHNVPDGKYEPGAGFARQPKKGKVSYSVATWFSGVDLAKDPVKAKARIFSKIHYRDTRTLAA